MNDLLILIPTRNEAGNIDNIIAELKHYFSNSFYLFVDDSSKDGTLEILEKYSEKESNLKVKTLSLLCSNLSSISSPIIILLGKYSYHVLSDLPSHSPISKINNSLSLIGSKYFS
jgi:glycosyltransferase involved in cell wall biosynthesis